MGWFVILGIAIVVVVCAIFATLLGYRLQGIATIVVTVVVFFGITAVMSYHQVETGHIGIVKQFGSLVDNGTTGDGLVSTAPWQSLDQVSVQNEIKTYEMLGDNAAVSKDSQAIFLIAQVNYSLNADKAIDLYRETGGHFVERILDPAVFQNTKEVTAGYKAVEFAQNRGVIRRKIEEAVSAEVKGHGITVLNVSLKNVDFTPELSKAIESTVVAEQDALAEHEKVDIETQKALQKVEEAKGDASAVRIRATADRDAAFLRKQQLNPLLVQWEAIQKLNPNVQIIVCPPRTVCVPNSTQLLPPSDGEQP